MSRVGCVKPCQAQLVRPASRLQALASDARAFDPFHVHCSVPAQLQGGSSIRTALHAEVPLHPQPHTDVIHRACPLVK